MTLRMYATTASGWAVIIMKDLHTFRFSITPSIRNALANRPSMEKRPALSPNTRNAPAEIRLSEQSSALPTSSEVYFLSMSATMSVPPEEARQWNMIAEPMPVSRMAYTSSRNGWSVMGCSSLTVRSRIHVMPE